MGLFGNKQLEKDLVQLKLDNANYLNKIDNLEKKNTELIEKNSNLTNEIRLKNKPLAEVDEKNFDAKNENISIKELDENQNLSPEIRNIELYKKFISENINYLYKHYKSSLKYKHILESCIKFINSEIEINAFDIPNYDEILLKEFKKCEFSNKFNSKLKMNQKSTEEEILKNFIEHNIKNIFEVYSKENNLNDCYAFIKKSINLDISKKVDLRILLQENIAKYEKSILSKNEKDKKLEEIEKKNGILLETVFKKFIDDEIVYLYKTYKSSFKYKHILESCIKFINSEIEINAFDIPNYDEILLEKFSDYELRNDKLINDTNSQKNLTNSRDLISKEKIQNSLQTSEEVYINFIDENIEYLHNKYYSKYNDINLFNKCIDFIGFEIDVDVTKINKYNNILMDKLREYNSKRTNKTTSISSEDLLNNKTLEFKSRESYELEIRNLKQKLESIDNVWIKDKQKLLDEINSLKNINTEISRKLNSPEYLNYKIEKKNIDKNLKELKEENQKLSTLNKCLVNVDKNKQVNENEVLERENQRLKDEINKLKELNKELKNSEKIDKTKFVMPSTSTDIKDMSYEQLSKLSLNNLDVGLRYVYRTELQKKKIEYEKKKLEEEKNLKLNDNFIYQDANRKINQLEEYSLDKNKKIIENLESRCEDLTKTINLQEELLSSLRYQKSDFEAKFNEQINQIKFLNEQIDDINDFEAKIEQKDLEIFKLKESISNYKNIVNKLEDEIRNAKSSSSTSNRVNIKRDSFDDF